MGNWEIVSTAHVSKCLHKNSFSKLAMLAISDGMLPERFVFRSDERNIRQTGHSEYTNIAYLEGLTQSKKRQIAQIADRRREASCQPVAS